MSLEEQIDRFKKGFPDVKLVAAATVGDGIKQVASDEESKFVEKYESASISCEKFVPASGAATRMFKDLLEFRTFGKATKSTKKFFDGVGSIPFGLEGSQDEILKELFGRMEFDKMPKGLLPFHKEDGKVKTPVEEHMVEALGYAHKEGAIKIHFTVSPEHQSGFEEKIKAAVVGFKQQFDISFSTQNPKTDTVAVSMDNTPVEKESGGFLYRPAGHGALLENLNSRDTDIVFIKNIDNVVPDRLKAETIKFKKILAGVLLEYQEKIFGLLEESEQGTLNKEEVRALLGECGVKGLSDEELQDKLNRPIRVCGMVRNSGEPGGGPFWMEKNGKVSLQIVEGAQVDKGDPEQLDTFNNSTHFNPVDIVCGLKDYKGRKYDLMHFADHETGFITEKSYMGKPIKTLELPGLWNGSMANWNTIFVEVPLLTFNPVKTVNDLLRPEHQA